MVLRWLRQNQKLWLAVVGMSLYVFVKGAFMYNDIITNHPGNNAQHRVNTAERTFMDPVISTRAPQLDSVSHVPQPVCTVDYLSQVIVPADKACAKPGHCENVTCRDVLYANNSDKSGDKAIYDRVRKFMKDQPKVMIKEADYINMTTDCDYFKRTRGYQMKPSGDEEEEFPIAYNILMHRDLEQVERLLRSIYRPQNSYCIHLDLNQPEIMQRAVKSIANCFTNVFLPTQSLRIVYAGISRLQADVNCMRDHLAKNTKWKYLINLAGQSFPLKTNQELVQILKTYNGSNDIEGIHGYRVLRSRFQNEWIELDFKKMNKTGNKNPKPPHDIDIVRGSAYGVFSHSFVDYIINDPWAKDLLEWSRKTWSPDEHYWATLHHTYSNPHMKPPGSYAGDPNKKPWLAVYVKWGGVDRCLGTWRRGVCVFGVADLPDLIDRREMFCNKFYLDFQPLGLDCLEAWIQQKTACPEHMELDYYRELPFVQKEKPHRFWFR